MTNKNANNTKSTPSKTKSKKVEKENATKKRVSPNKTTAKKSQSKKEVITKKKKALAPVKKSAKNIEHNLDEKEKDDKILIVKEEKENKKIIIKLSIATIFILMLIVGAAYAYFAVSTTEDSNTTQVTINAATLGTVVLTNPTPNLHIRLDAVSMSVLNGGNIYYATDDANADYETIRTPRTVAKATLSGGDADLIYRCTFNLNVALSGTMASALQTGDASIIFSGAYEGEYDLATVANTRVVTFENISSTNNEKEVQIVVKFNNKNTSQDYLVNTSMNIVISNSDFSCKASNAQGQSENVVTYKYYTYSDDAYENDLEGINGFTTSKLSAPASSWEYYIKETNTPTEAQTDLYAIKYFNEIDHSYLYTSQEDCEANLWEDATCEEIATEGNTYGALTLEACLVVNGTDMCFRPDNEQMANIYSVLDSNGFVCNDYESDEYLECFNGLSAYNTGDLYINISSESINVGYFDQDTCSLTENYAVCYKV